jgi:hypothetical protein
MEKVVVSFSFSFYFYLFIYLFKNYFKNYFSCLPLPPPSSNSTQIKKGKKKREEKDGKEKENLKVLSWARGQHKWQVDYETRFTHPETDPMDN